MWKQIDYKFQIEALEKGALDKPDDLCVIHKVPKPDNFIVIFYLY